MVDMRLDRRTFLRQAGLSLFALGMSEADISFITKKQLAAAQALAATSNRKLALLIGIDRYKSEQLKGCSTDIELEKELLVDRFGFNPKDIVTLSDGQATRESIENTFVEHLIRQAEADDVVFFHFSGFGGRAKMPMPEENSSSDSAIATPYQLVNTLIPVDGMLPTKSVPTANVILQETLLLLAQSLATDRLTLVLDTSYGNVKQLLRGNFRIRSNTQVAEQIDSGELAFQEQLQNKLATKGLKPYKRLVSVPGIVLAAASQNQIAAEGQWDGFSAGLFTYALTQSFWQMTPSSKVSTVVGRSAEAVERVMGRQQQPTVNNIVKPLIAYYLNDNSYVSAEGIVTAVETQGNIEVKLIGLPATILNSYGNDSCLSLVTDDGSQPNLLQVKSRDGLAVKVRPVSRDSETVQNIKERKLVREEIRVFPRDLGLTIALDANLQRIERVDATSALANIKAVASVVAAGEQNADCVIGKIFSSRDRSKTDSASKTQDSESAFLGYGLFSSGGVLVERTAGTANEAVKSAISRLSPQFDNILAAKWLDLIINGFSSRLKVASTLELIERNKISSLQRATVTAKAERETASKEFPLSPEESTSIPILAKGSHIRFCLTNECKFPLYGILIGIDSDRNIFALYTPQEIDTAKETRLENLTIPPQAQLLVPESEESWKWKVSIAPGIAEIYAIFATKPFDRTMTVLASQPNLKLDREQVLNVSNALETVKALLEDLHAASSVPAELLSSSNNVYALDVDSWATLSFVYEVVAES